MTDAPQGVAYAEVPEFMVKLRERTSTSARALEFAILTGARTGEVIGARWSEIDLAAATWTVPAERMKAGREHKVPLSPAAIALLQALPREAADDGYVFEGERGRPLSNMAMTMVLRSSTAPRLCTASGRASATGRRKRPSTRTRCARWPLPIRSRTGRGRIPPGRPAGEAPGDVADWAEFLAGAA